MEIQLIIQQLLKDSQPDDILDESVGKIESLTPIIKVSEGVSGALEPESSFYVGTAAGVMPTLIVSEELYPFYLDLDPDEFVARLNKTLYTYINFQLENDRNRNVSDNDNIWMQPNAEFVKWFHEKGIDLDLQSSFIASDIKVEKNVGGRPKDKGGRPPDPKLEEKKRRLNKEYYNLTKKKGFTKSKAMDILEKKYSWTKSTIETYLK